MLHFSHFTNIYFQLMLLFVTLRESTETVFISITIRLFNKLILFSLFLFFKMTCRLDIEGLVPSHAAHLVL
jgi:hypothetical protein